MTTNRPLGCVAVLGLGVIGGSVARALSDVGIAERVIGWSPESTERDAALTARAITFGAAEWPQAVEDADLVVLATPLSATLDIMAALPEAAPGAAITDVAGLKQPVADAASEAGLSDRWVGSHPMAGSERSGFWASRGDLFQGARVWLVSEGAEEAVYRRVRRLWTAVGAVPAEIEAWEHDRLMAVASHLPQLLANALADVLGQADVRPDRLGPGGKDMTRLAGSGAEMWADLLQHARPELVEGLRGVGRTVERLANDLEAGDLADIEALMRKTRAWRGGR